MWLNIKRLYFFNSERQTEYASIAQLAEHAAVNRGVTGSSPVWGANKKDRTMCGLFVSVGTSAQFSHLRHRIAVMECGCYLSQTKQSGELFCRSDTMRQRQLPPTYLQSQVRAARTSQSPFCHSVTFPLSGESLFEAPSLGNENQTQLKVLELSRAFVLFMSIF